MEPQQLLDDHIRTLEEQLLRPEVRRSRQRLEELLAAEFVEFASDGRAYGKVQVIEALQSEQPFDRSLTDFHFVLLSDNVVLSTFRCTKRGAASHEAFESLRSSIWKYSEDRWQLIFHQGTVCAALRR